MEFLRNRSEKAKFNACKHTVERAILGTNDVIEALTCSRRFSELFWFEQANRDTGRYIEIEITANAIRNDDSLHQNKLTRALYSVKCIRFP